MAQLNAQPVSVGNQITLDCSKQPLKVVLDEITSQSGAVFIYSDALIKNAVVTCRFKDSRLEKALSKILEGCDISFRMYDKSSVVLFKKKTPPVTDFKPAVVNINIPETKMMQELTRPIILNQKIPAYPVEAIAKKYEGKVGIKLFVTKDGGVSKVEIAKSSGYSVLDSATIAYSEKLKFVPAKLNGEPHNAWLEITFNYHFNNR